MREEIHHVREGKHGAKNAKQAIAIGLSKARRAGVNLPASRNSSAKTKQSATAALRAGKKRKKASPARSRATSQALKREGNRAASKEALARQAHAAATHRSPAARSASARRGGQTRKHQHASA